ncbi:Crp/Fnr family transcriptional regulator [Acidobacteria bacterium AH-259-A15]|nr:Crp/Fnr family transcriptional regulator [Acidobacteria bacterium AH-259-A15]
MKNNQDFLRQVAIFAPLADAEMESVAQMFKERRYKRNEIIFVEEDTGKYMYVIKEGRVKVSRILPNGRETILTFHQAGDYFGEMSLIDGETAPATVTAVVPTTILFITHRDFSLLLENPKVNRTLLEMLCKRCRDAWVQISVLTFHHADARIRAVLYHLCQKHGRKTNRGTRISLHLTHRELSEMAGISRETATRVLGQLQSEEVVAVEEGHFLISDPEKLVQPLLFE